MKYLLITICLLCLCGCTHYRLKTETVDLSVWFLFEDREFPWATLSAEGDIELSGKVWTSEELEKFAEALKPYILALLIP